MGGLRGFQTPAPTSVMGGGNSPSLQFQLARAAGERIRASGEVPIPLVLARESTRESKGVARSGTAAEPAEILAPMEFEPRWLPVVRRRCVPSNLTSTPCWTPVCRSGQRSLFGSRFFTTQTCHTTFGGTGSRASRHRLNGCDVLVQFLTDMT